MRVQSSFSSMRFGATFKGLKDPYFQQDGFASTVQSYIENRLQPTWPVIFSSQMTPDIQITFQPDPSRGKYSYTFQVSDTRQGESGKETKWNNSFHTEIGQMRKDVSDLLKWLADQAIEAQYPDHKTRYTLSPGYWA